jgi:hypothetical protein
MKVELAVLKGALARLVELAAKDSAEHLDGKKEVVAWFDPARASSRQPTGWDHAMYMRVKCLILIAPPHGERTRSVGESC